jgi:hypothetical protein
MCGSLKLASRNERGQTQTKTAGDVEVNSSFRKPAILEAWFREKRKSGRGA